MTPSDHNRAFMLGLSSLGLACAFGDTGATSTSSSLPTGPVSGPGTTDGGGTTGSTSGDTSTPTGSASDTGPAMTSMGPSTTDPDGDSSDGPPSTSSGGYGYYVCSYYGLVIGECYEEPAYIEYLIEYCYEYFAHLELLGEFACITAYEDFVACIGSLSCKELLADGCAAEGQALAALNCPTPPP